MPLTGFEIGIIIVAVPFIIFHIVGMFIIPSQAELTKMRVEMYRQNIEDLVNATQKEKTET